MSDIKSLELTRPYLISEARPKKNYDLNATHVYVSSL